MRKFLSALVAVAALSGVGAAVAPVAEPVVVEALVGDPTVNVVHSPADIHVGDVVTFTITISQPGFVPTNGSQRMYRRNQATGSTINWANYQVLPMTVIPGGWQVTYRAGPADPCIRCSLIFSVTTPIPSAARIPRTVAGTDVINVAA